MDRGDLPDGLDRQGEPLEERPSPPERTYSGDMVLLVLFFILVAVLGLLFFARSQVG